MRLNRENTLIENNLYPLAGCHPPEVRQKFVEMLQPYETDVLQIEAALLLHNIPLFIVFSGFLITFLTLSLWLTPCVISYLSYVIIAFPLLTLVYTLGGVKFGRSLYLRELPDTDDADPRRVRSLAEVVGLIAPVLLWGWRLAFFVYRTFICPNAIDGITLITVAVIIGWIAKLINPLGLLLVLTVAGLLAPALFTLTPAKEWIAALINAIKSKASRKPEKAE
jgi:hypothetical protein